MVLPISIPGFPYVHARRSAATCDSALESRVASLEASLETTIASLPSLIAAAINKAFDTSLERFSREMLSRGAGEGNSAPLAGDHHGSPAIDPILLPRSPVCAGGAQPQLIPSAVQASPLLSSSSLLQALTTLAVKPHSNKSSASTVSLLGSKNVIHDSVMTTASQLLSDCSESVISNLCKFSGNEFAPHTFFTKIGAEFMQAMPTMLENKCQKEVVGMSARYVFDEILDSCCCVVLDHDMCYYKGIHDNCGGSKFRSLDDCQMRLEKKIAKSGYDDNIGYFIKKKLHVWCQLPSGLWELGMIRRHETRTGQEPEAIQNSVCKQ